MRNLCIVIFSAALSACATTKNQTPNPISTPPPPVMQNSLKKAPPQMNADTVRKEICESGKDKRSLEVRKKSAGCDLSYTKFGKEKIVASGKYGIKHCQDSFDKVTKELEADKFSCH